MARVKLSEFRAKSLLVSGYDGIRLCEHIPAKTMQAIAPNRLYVVKVDQGIKKRGKNGLLMLNVKKKDIPVAVRTLARKGYERFLLEPMHAHAQDEEKYLCLERTREGINISYGEVGGIDVEEHSDSIKRYTDPKQVPCGAELIENIIDIMNQNHISFVEINPLVLQQNTPPQLLDAAVLVDSAGEHESKWSRDDIVDSRVTSGPEESVAMLNDNSPASFSLRVLNADAPIWLLLSGGGASITIADEASNQGRADAIGNYGEYSGGPTTGETYLYTKQLLELLRASKATKKALVIAGGVANFTDVEKTFRGVVHALDEDIDSLKKQDIRVFVRRGGPNEREGLSMMEQYLKKHMIFGSIHGSDAVLTDVINEALEYVDAA